MPAKKTKSKTTGGKRKKASTKTKTSSKAKKVVKKKPAAKKKKSVAKPKSKPKAKKKASTVKKKVSSTKEKETLFVLTMDEKPKVNDVKPKQDLPVIDLEKLASAKAKSVAIMKSPEHSIVSIGSRVSFYLGVFFGAVVVNVFILTLIAVFSV